MSRFIDQEKPRQAAFKRDRRYFSEAAQAEGVYKRRHRYPFCLPVECANENLIPEIREAAPAFFAKHRIKWHDGQNGQPSNHMCDSQVSCVNFLFPFAQRPDELAVVLRRVFPDLRRMLPIEDGHYVTFEWIGEHNYLGEKISRNGVRTRGAHFTSADAAVMFERKNGDKHIVLMEWKYTESYYPNPLQRAKSGTSRAAIYQRLYDADGCPLNKARLPSFESLFFEPFYQFTRQQFLANEMEKARELGASTVSLLHIAPAHNLDFRRVTSPTLASLGDSATSIWTSLVSTHGKFTSISTEALFGVLTPADLPEMQAWLDYIQARYAWIKEPVPA